MCTKITYAELINLIQRAAGTAVWLTDTLVVWDRFPVSYSAEVYPSYVELTSASLTD